MQTDMQALELFTKACSKYQEASDLPREQGERAVQLYREAAELYEQILRSGFEHPDIYYNLGNAYFKVNDLGRAVLNYRRAERFTPSDPDLAENLRSAKSKVLDQEPDRRPPELLRTLLFWHYETSLLFLAKAALASYLALCAALCAHIFARKAPLRWLVKALAVLTVALTVSFAVRFYQDKTQRVAVVLAADARVRTGYSEKETEKFVVHAGTELMVEDIREVEGERWLKVALSKDLRGWIRGAAVAIVQDRPKAELQGFYRSGLRRGAKGWAAT
jgi:tetratricopeptide (TPR) repeat protein